MIRGARPAALAIKFPLCRQDRPTVDAGMAMPVEAVLVVFPVLVAVGAEPIAGSVAIFVGESYRDAVLGKRPQLLDQPVLQLAFPLSREKRHDVLAALENFGAVAPFAVDRIAARHELRVARVPGVFRAAHLLDRGFPGERRKRRP